MLRALVAIAMVEAAVIATLYLLLGEWRRRGRVGWFLLLLGGSVAWMLVMSVLGWWVSVPLVLWLPALVAFDVALGLWLSLLLRKSVLKGQGGKEE